MNRLVKVAGTAVTALTSPSQAVVIDSFDTPQALLVSGQNTVAGTTDLGDGILGEERDAVLRFQGLGSVKYNVFSSSHSLVFNLRASAGELEVHWDGIDADPYFDLNPDGFGAHDFTEGGAHDTLRLNIENAIAHAHPDLVLLVYLESTSGGLSAAWHTFVVGESGAHTLHFPFDDFQGTADMSDIKRVQLYIASQQPLTDAYLEIGSIETVPSIPVCDGDADADGAVDANDISFVIFRLGATGAPGSLAGDADGNGTIDMNDVAYVIFRLGSAC